MSGIDDDLSNTESVDLLRDKLEYSVVTRLNTAFRNSGKTWATIRVTCPIYLGEPIPMHFSFLLILINL